jgi:hypothetical protein
MTEYSMKYKIECENIRHRKSVDKYDLGDCGYIRRVLPDIFFGFILGALITFIYMYMNNDSIICNEYYCYAHKHSWVCYIGWMAINGHVGAILMCVLVFIIGYPIIYNLRILVTEIIDRIKINQLKYEKPTKEDKQKESKKAMDKFLNFKSMRF